MFTRALLLVLSLASSLCAADPVINSPLNGQALKVALHGHPPFMMWKAGWEERGLQGNDRFEGFCVDLVDELAKVLGFRFTFQEVADKRYGEYDEQTGKWNGVMGAVLDGPADVGIADLTITFERERFVDFTYPYMATGIAAIFKKSQEPSALKGALAILSPFTSVTFWLLLVATIALTVLRIVFARSHGEDGLGDGSTSKRSSGKCLHTTLKSMWWVMLLLLVAHYTANLSATLTAEKVKSPDRVHEVYSIEQLAAQKEIQYGCVKGGSTCSFFKKSNHTTYATMWQRMNQVVPTGNNESSLHDGVVRTKEGGFAFLTEAATLEYLLKRECDLYQVGGQIDSKGYGIALKKDSPYREPFSQAILYLQEYGVIATLKSRWWTSGSCD